MALNYAIGLIVIAVWTVLIFLVGYGVIGRNKVEDAITMFVGMLAFIAAPIASLVAGAGNGSPLFAAACWCLVILCVISSRLRR